MTSDQAYTLILQMAAEQTLLRVRDIQARGIHPEYLRRLHHQGKLRRIARGLYTLPEIAATEHHSLALAATMIPQGIVCLLSALRFHGLTTESPTAVWIMIDRKARRPTVSDIVSLRFVHASGQPLAAGVEEHWIEGRPVRISSVAKTVIDCFRFRNKIGIDVAIEALKECRRGKHCSIDTLWYYAKVCRVGNIIRPYLEALG